MTFEQALAWLDARGGRWSARANGSTCDVEVELGANLVTSPASRLHHDEVRSALVLAVQRLQAATATS